MMSRVLAGVVFMAAGAFPALDTPAEAVGQDRADASKWEYKAVYFGGDEKENTAKLNALAAENWEYVGPLNSGMVAFRRVGSVPVSKKTLVGIWEGRVGGRAVKVDIKDPARFTGGVLRIVDDKGTMDSGFDYVDTKEPAEILWLGGKEGAPSCGTVRLTKEGTVELNLNLAKSPNLKNRIPEGGVTSLKRAQE